MLKSEYVLECPGCGDAKEPDWVICSRSYSARRLDVPYFMCGKCQLICINRTIVRKAISDWRNDGFVSKNTPPYEKLYKEMIDIVGRVVDLYCQTAGYKCHKFRKISS